MNNIIPWALLVLYPHSTFLLLYGAGMLHWHGYVVIPVYGSQAKKHRFVPLHART
jgi:hypothetical protein